MPRSRAEIQKDIIIYKAGLDAKNLDLNDPIWDDKSDPRYLGIKKARDNDAEKIREFERELAELKTSGDRGRSLEEIRKEISEKQSNINEYRLLQSRSTNPLQWSFFDQTINFLQGNVNALQHELKEAEREEVEEKIKKEVKKKAEEKAKKEAEEKAKKEAEEKAEIEKIKQIFEQEINSSPNNTNAYIKRGHAFATCNMSDGGKQIFFDHAIADFTKAIELDDKAADAYLFRAGLYSQKNKHDFAFNDYTLVINIDSNNIDTKKAEAYAFRGGIYTQKGDYDKALDDFNNAIQKNLKCKNAYTFRGGMYFQRGVQNKENANYDKAISDIDNAIVDIEEALKLDLNDMAANYLIKNVRNEKEVVDRILSEQQEQYDGLVQKMNNASTENEFQDLARQLRTMHGYKNTIELANKCDNQYQELKKERERREAEEAAKKEAKNKKKRLIGILAAMIAVAGLIALIVYRQTGSFFQFQRNVQGEMTITGYSGKKQVVIPAVQNGVNVVKIGDNAFSDKKLTSVSIPDGVTIIGENAFRNNRLTSVVIPDSVTIIGHYAFFNNKLTSVILGNGVTTIGDYSFSGNLNSNGYPTNDGNQLTNVSIPDSVTIIGQRAFRYNQLLGVTIGNSVKTIGNRAFSTNKLTSVIIPDSVTSIEDAAFIANKLTHVDIGKNVISIRDSVFEKNLLANITIPNSVTSIGLNAFADNPITSIRIGTNVKLGNKDSNGILGENTGFNTAYTNQKSRAGTYTRTNITSTTWTRKQ